MTRYLEPPEGRTVNYNKFLEEEIPEEPTWDPGPPTQRYWQPRQALAEYLWTSQDECCAYCGKKLPLCDVEVDHVIPRIYGGTDWMGNLVASCRPCNSAKGPRTVEEWANAVILGELQKSPAPAEGASDRPLAIFSERFAAALNPKRFGTRPEST